MNSIQKYLEILELNYLPGHEELQKNFSRLLKEYHPDRNRDRQEWANEKTRRLIEAMDKVRDFLSRNEYAADMPQYYNSYSYSYYPDEDEELFESRYKDKKSCESQIQVQILRSDDKDYVLLLKSILRVVICNPKQIRKIFNKYYYLYENTVFALSSLDGSWTDPLFSDYIILYKSVSGNTGFTVPGNVRFSRTERISRREIIFKKDSRGNITEAEVNIEGEPFHFPSATLADLLAESNAPCAR